MGGPIWNGPIFDNDALNWVRNELKTHSEDFGSFTRLYGLLCVMDEAWKLELSVKLIAAQELKDVPLHYTLDGMCSQLHITVPSQTLIRSALLNAGYRVSSVHTNQTALKTDAPNSVLWDILREWAKENPPKVCSIIIIVHLSCSIPKRNHMVMRF